MECICKKPNGFRFSGMTDENEVWVHIGCGGELTRPRFAKGVKDGKWLWTFDRRIEKVNKLKSGRLMAGISQEELAQRANVTRETIRQAELGRNIGVHSAIRISKVLGFSVEYLFGWTGEDE